MNTVDQLDVGQHRVDETELVLVLDVDHGVLRPDTRRQFKEGDRIEWSKSGRSCRKTMHVGAVGPALVIMVQLTLQLGGEVAEVVLGGEY